MVWLTQAFFYGVPWLNWSSRQAVLFDLGAKRFYIFGLILYPQDFIYLAGILIVSALALFLFTTVAGRLWCGYTCPQTVYTKVFMWLQQRIEGDRSARMRRDAASWSAQKLARKSGTHFESLNRLKSGLRELNLHTVCESARCPNIHECFHRGAATFMILGNWCTRGCGFCSVPKASPSKHDMRLDPAEPADAQADALWARDADSGHCGACGATFFKTLYTYVPWQPASA